MLRRLHQIALVASLALLAVTLSVWIRSYWRSDAFVHFGSAGHTVIQWGSGTVVVGIDDVGTTPPRYAHEAFKPGKFGIPYTGGMLNRLGFSANRIVTQSSSLNPRELAGFPSPPPAVIVAHLYSVPLWSVMLAGGLVPIISLPTTLRNRYRQRAGLCLSCGYDLRASPGRCPECGNHA